MSTATATAAAITVQVFRSPEGCVAYLIADEATGSALVLDPRLDQVDVLVQALAGRRVRLTHVLDTHTHADHLSGVRALAQRTGATVLAHTTSKLKGPAQRVAGGSRIQVGGTTFTVLDAPGHTSDSLALLAEGHLFTGDALFVGGAGRTDFMGGSASDLFDTFRAFEALPDSTVVHPGHDYVGRPETTIGAEKAENTLLRERDRATFMTRMSSKAAPPANMSAILRHNLGEASAPTIAPAELQALREQGSAPVIVDVRSPIEFEGERIEGSLSMPLETLDATLHELPEQADVIVVCRTGVRATIAAEALGRAGHRSRVLEGGVLAWRGAKLPLKVGRKRLPVDRQVQLIAGSMVLSGVALGTLVNPWLLGISAFFGAGLTFAGATGTCGLAHVLMRMPWNRPLGLPPSEGSTCAAGGAALSSCAAPVSSTCAAPTTREP